MAAGFDVNKREGRMVEAVRDHWLVALAVVILVAAVVAWWRAR